MRAFVNFVKSVTYIKLLFAGHFAIVFLLILLTYPWRHGDSNDYLWLAEGLSTGRFGIETDEGFQLEGLRLPAYPLIIFIYKLIFGENYLGLIIIQAGLYLASVYFVWKILNDYFNQATGIIFLTILLPYIFIVYTVCLILTEAWCIFLITSTIFLLIKYQNSSRGFLAAVAAGCLLGLSLYFRPNLFPLTVALFAGLLIANYRQWKSALLFLVMSWAIILPYAVYNYINFNQFTTVPVASNVGLSLLQATWQNRVPVESFTDFASNGKMDGYIIKSGMAEQFIDVYSNTETALKNSSYQKDRKKIQYQIFLNKFAREKAFENIRNDPGAYLFSSFKNMVRMWFASYNQSFRASQITKDFDWIRFSIIIPGIVMFVFGGAGCFYGFLKPVSKQAKAFTILAVACFLNFTFTMCWLHTESRYTTPVRLFLVATAAIACYYLFLPIIKKIRIFNPALTEN